MIVYCCWWFRSDEKSKKTRSFSYSAWRHVWRNSLCNLVIGGWLVGHIFPVLLGVCCRLYFGLDPQLVSNQTKNKHIFHTLRHKCWKKRFNTFDSILLLVIPLGWKSKENKITNRRIRKGWFQSIWRTCVFRSFISTLYVYIFDEVALHAEHPSRRG